MEQLLRILFACALKQDIVAQGVYQSSSVCVQNEAVVDQPIESNHGVQSKFHPEVELIRESSSCL